jgi:TatD DNase family protein
MQDFEYFDLHSHLHDAAFDADRDEVIAQMKTENVGTILIGTDLFESENAVNLSYKSKNLYVAIGLHPADNPAEEFDAEKYKELYELNRDKVVAVGECGLDYFYIENFLKEASEEYKQKDKERQKKIFAQQIELASDLQLPLMLHIRDVKDKYDAYFDAYEMLKDKNIKCNVHFFTGNMEVTKKFLEIGATFSLPGIITFAREYDEIIRFIPIENLHAETDSPYATPIPHRGERNSPLNIKHIVAKIAEIKGLEEDFVKEKLLENARRFTLS